MRFVFLFLILFSALSVSAQNTNKIHAQIHFVIENRDYKTAANELLNFARSDKKIFVLNNYDYLLARMAEKTGDLATAMANYQAVASRNSVLSEYALRHLSQIVRDSGNLMLERIYLRELLTIAPNGLLNDAAEARITRSYFESRDFDATIRLLEKQTANETDSANSKFQGKENLNSKIQNLNSENLSQKFDYQNSKNRQNLVLLARAFQQNENLNAAREIFTRLTINLPNPAQPDDFALESVESLDLLDGGDENFGKIAPRLSEVEHLRRAFIYQFNRRFQLARLHYQAIVERFPQSQNAADALFQIGRGFVQEGDYTEGINWFERVQTEFPNNPITKDALIQTASAYSRLNKSPEAISCYRKFIEKYPNAENLERAYLNIVDILRDDGKDAEALEWTAKTEEAFRGKLPEATALFAEARIYIAQNDWQNALKDLTKLQNFPDLGGTRVPAGGANKAEITFLKGLVLEKLNLYAEAIDAYLSIPDGRGEFYGWRATERLKDLENNSQTKPFVESKLGALSETTRFLSPDEERKMLQSVYRLTNDSIDLDKIKSVYAKLPNYQKIPNFKLLEFGRKEILTEKDEISDDNPHKIIADELLFLGLYEEATPELETYLKKIGEQKPAGTENDKSNPKTKTQKLKSNDANYTLAVFYERGEAMANRAVEFAEPLWQNVPADYEIELISHDQLKLLYPAPFADSLLRFAPAKQVDARFILAIMRQESRFRAAAKSFAAARGLLQFTSNTADRIAAELGRNDFFSQSELYNPPTAILFGSQYLSNLFRQFPNQPEAVAASYNGGEDNVARWLKRAKTDNPDFYVSEIVFAQSKDYVYKVLANYRIYQMFYDENLQPK